MATIVTDPADPQRCKELANGREQCWNKAENGETCPEHTKGQIGRPKKAMQTRNLYELGRIKARLAEVVEYGAEDSLAEEIATLRCLIQSDLEAAENSGDAETVSKATTRAKEGFLAVEKLVKTQHSLKETQGALISRAALLRFSQSVCNVITDEIRGLPGWESISDRIGERIMELVSKVQNGE